LLAQNLPTIVDYKYPTRLISYRKKGLSIPSDLMNSDYTYTYSDANTLCNKAHKEHICRHVAKLWISCPEIIF